MLFIKNGVILYLEYTLTSYNIDGFIR